MMENISLSDPEDIPLPPDQVEIRNLNAEPHEDGKRVHISLTFTPFQESPSADIVIYNEDGEKVANVNIIEMIDPETEITVHLRHQDTTGKYQVVATAFYLDQELSEEESVPVKKPEKNMIGREETTFIIPK